jgi:hypothetical protein
MTGVLPHQPSSQSLLSGEQLFFYKTKDCTYRGSVFNLVSPEPVVIVVIWRRKNREVVHGQSGVRGQAAPMPH